MVRVITRRDNRPLNDAIRRSPPRVQILALAIDPAACISHEIPARAIVTVPSQTIDNKRQPILLELHKRKPRHPIVTTNGVIIIIAMILIINK